mgnify:CR=1 FL=1
MPEQVVDNPSAQIITEPTLKTNLETKYHSMVDHYGVTLWRVGGQNPSPHLKQELKRMWSGGKRGGRPRPEKLKRLGVSQEDIDDIIQQDKAIREIMLEIDKL